MPAPALRCEVHRRRDLDGGTLYFMIYSRSRNRPHRFFKPDQVPPFEGESAWFEVTRSRRGDWTLVRQVPPG